MRKAGAINTDPPSEPQLLPGAAEMYMPQVYHRHNRIAHFYALDLERSYEVVSPLP